MIIVDTREPTKIDGILRRLKIPFRRQTLTYGDYKIGELIIERKTCGDFVGSIMSQRLDNQMYKLSQFDYPWLVLIGDFDAVIRGFKKRGQKLNPAIVGGAIGSIMIRYPTIHFGWFQHDRQMLYIMNKAGTKMGEGKYGIPRRSNIIYRGNRQVGALSSILRMSPNISRTLLSRFGTIRALSKATVKELEYVSGIGPIKAREIKERISIIWNGVSKV